MEYKGFDKNFNITDKVAVITGGASGIGHAIAKLYIEKGAKVALLDLKKDVVEVANKLDSEKALGIKADVTSEENISVALEKVLSYFNSIDILVNCAGVALLDDAENISDEYWRNTMELNLTGSFKVAQKVGNIMIESGNGGKIINMSSQGSIIALDNHVAYNTSKAGILGMTRGLAAEWAEYDIAVNAISPTVILTELGKKAWAGEKGEKAKAGIPMKRFGYPEEVAAVAVFLASDAANLITGENIVIDGGNTIV